MIYNINNIGNTMYSRGNTEHKELHSPTHPSPPAWFRLCGPAEVQARDFGRGLNNY